MLNEHRKGENMAVEKLNENLNIISTLDDKPSLSSADLKAKFDEGSNLIKKYINEILVPALNSGLVTIVNDLTTGGSTKVASAEMVKKLNIEKQSIIGYGTTVPTLEEGQIFIQIFD